MKILVVDQCVHFYQATGKNGKLKIEIYDPKVKTIWEHILIFDREDYNTALFLHVDDRIKEVTRVQMANLYT